MVSSCPNTRSASLAKSPIQQKKELMAENAAATTDSDAPNSTETTKATDLSTHEMEETEYEAAAKPAEEQAPKGSAAQEETIDESRAAKEREVASTDTTQEVSSEDLEYSAQTSNDIDVNGAIGEDAIPSAESAQTEANMASKIMGQSLARHAFAEKRNMNQMMRLKLRKLKTMSNHSILRKWRMPLSKPKVNNWERYRIMHQEYQCSEWPPKLQPPRCLVLRIKQAWYRV